MENTKPTETSPQKHTMDGSAEYATGEGQNGTETLPATDPNDRLHSISRDGYFTSVTEVPEPHQHSNQQPSHAGIKFGVEGRRHHCNQPYTQEFRHTTGHKRKRYVMVLSGKEWN